MNFASILEYDELANYSSMSLATKVHNMSAIIVSDYGRFFLLEPNFRLTKIASRLWIDKSTGQIIEKDLHEKDYLISKSLKTKKGYSAFLGSLNLINEHFFVFVEQAAWVCQLEGNDIYQISSVELLPFEDKEKLVENPQWKEIKENIELIKRLLSFGFYFSFTYDLTRNTDKIDVFSAQEKLHDEKFWWNQYMLKDVSSQKISGKWQMPIIQKGIDDDGYVANFVETEQIIYYSFYKCAFVQTRGSVPCFWEQTGLTAAVRLTRELTLCTDAFSKHFKDMQHDYQRILCINLMSSKKKSEILLNESFEKLVQDAQLSHVRYEYFDFHHACKGQKYENVDVLIEKLKNVLESLKFYASKRKNATQQILLTQKGVVRINCLDCLDRTNVVMTKVAALMLQNIMKHMNTDLTQALGQDLIKLLDMPISQSQKIHPFVYYFKNAWADNGDYLSVHYAGTGSTISTITRTAKAGFLNMLDHGMKSIERFFINNFEDHMKQKAIDSLLGQKTHESLLSKYEETLESQLMEKRHEYIAYSKLILAIFTWNVGNCKPVFEENVRDKLFSFEVSPDIVVIGLQEIAKTGLFTATDAEKHEKIESSWRQLLTNQLRKLGEYFEVSHLSFYGCLLMVFARNSLRERVKRIKFDEISFSGLTNFSQKGAVLIKFHVDDTSLCFINGHLDAGTLKERAQNINTIHNSAFNEDLETFEYKFLFGDLNFKLLGVSDAEIRKKIQKSRDLREINEFQQAQEALKELFSYDESWEIRKTCHFLEKYQENDVLFEPTCKFVEGSAEYQLKKTPFWGDRILAWIDEDSHLNLIEYEAKEIYLSQHKPVVGCYEIETKLVDQDKKGKIIQDYIVKIDENVG